MSRSRKRPCYVPPHWSCWMFLYRVRLDDGFDPSPLQLAAARELARLDRLSRGLPPRPRNAPAARGLTRIGEDTK